jgi:DNA-binding NarL/FixJ family response regulator
MDLTIPGGMGGLEALRELLALDSGARAIVSSGYSSDPVMADPGAYGFAGVIPKPYCLADLERILGQVPARQ